MTRVKVRKINGKIIYLGLFGHTDYDEEGCDIVCAGLSCIVQTAVLGIFSIAKVNAKLMRNEERGELELELPSNLSEKEIEVCDIILQTAVLGISDLKDGYSDYIKLEVTENVY